MRRFTGSILGFMALSGAALADTDPARQRLLAALDGLAEASGSAVEKTAPAPVQAPIAAANVPEAEAALTALPQAALAEATVAEATLAPATTGEAVAPPPTRRKTPLGALNDREVETNGQSGWMAVGVALLALTGVAFALKRTARKTVAAKGLAIETLASARVSGKHAVSVVRVGGRVLVVGQSEQGLTLLTELSDDELPSNQKPARSEAAPAVDTGAGSFVERVNRMRAGWKDTKGERGEKGAGFPTDPFHAALMKDAPVDELTRIDERAQIRERLEALRRRSLSVA